MSIKAIIFDFGGVLVRTEDHSARGKWAERLGVEGSGVAGLIFDSEASHRATTGRGPTEDIWNRFGHHFGLTQDELEEFERDFWSGDKLDMRLVDYLKSLRPAYKIGILSNAWSNARDIFRRQYGLDYVVDEMIISAEEGIAKPDPRIYKLAAERLGVRPDQAVFVDDMPINVEAARSVGMCGVRFENTEQTIADVQHCLDDHS